MYCHYNVIFNDLISIGSTVISDLGSISLSSYCNDRLVPITFEIEYRVDRSREEPEYWNKIKLVKSMFY